MNVADCWQGKGPILENIARAGIRTGSVSTLRSASPRVASRVQPELDSWRFAVNTLVPTDVLHRLADEPERFTGSWLKRPPGVETGSARIGDDQHFGPVSSPVRSAAPTKSSVETSSRLNRTGTGSRGARARWVRIGMPEVQTRSCASAIPAFVRASLKHRTSATDTGMDRQSGGETWAKSRDQRERAKPLHRRGACKRAVAFRRRPQ